MYPSKRPMSTLGDDNVPSDHRKYRKEKLPNSDEKIKVTHYSDGSSKYHFGGPVGSVAYDANGEEC